MPIHGQCPGCGRKFQAPDKLSGKRVKCPNCSAEIQLGHGDQQRAVRQSTSGEEASPTPTPPEQPSQKKAQWYVKTAAGEQLGPMGKAQVDALVAEGRLDGFCHLRREDWQQWKWAEAVYPQFALPAESEAKAAAKDAPTEIDVPTVVPDTESRLRPCPDCGKMVSKRAGQCPDCGCPLGSPDDQAAAEAAEATGYQADDTSSVAGSSQERSRAKRRQVGLVIAGAGSAMLLMIVLAAIVGWQLWRKSTRALDDAVESLATELTAQDDLPQERTVQQDRKAEETSDMAATPEEMQQCIEQTAAAAAKQIDGLYRKVHLFDALRAKSQQGMDLLQSLAEGNLDNLPEAEPEDDSYQSQYKPLYDECLPYIRKNLSAGELDRSKVRDLADRWADSKRGPLEEELEKQLQKQLGL